MRQAEVQTVHGDHLVYPDIDVVRVDKDGNLRLGHSRRRGLFGIQRVFHPAGEWIDVLLLARPPEAP